MKDIVKLIASKLAERNQVIRYGSSTVFDLINSYGNTNDSISVVAGKLANGLINDINLIRNSLVPVRNDLRNIVNELLDTTTNNNIFDGVVVPVKLPHIVDELYSRNVLNTNVSKAHFDNKIMVIEKPDNIKNYVTFGNTFLDNLLRDILNKYDDAAFNRIWEKYFYNVSSSSPAYNALDKLDIGNMDEYIIAYAIVSVLGKDKQLVKYVSDGDYFNNINNLKIFINGLINNLVNKYKAEEKSKILISGLNDKKLYVNENVYNEFLKTNSVEVLLGFIIKHNTIKNVELKDRLLDNVMLNADTYQMAYDHFIKIENLNRSFREIERYKLAYEQALIDLYKDIPTDVMEHVTYIPSAIHDILKIFFGRYDNNEILDINLMVTDIIADIVFARTSFKSFVKNMEDMMKMNNKLTPTDAATLAGIDLIIDYLIKQLGLEGA